MKNLFIIIILILPFGCIGQSTELEVFKKELGQKKFKSLETLFDSFEKFLALNYPNEPDVNERKRNFLKDILLDKKPFEFDETNVKHVLKLLEKTELRKEIYLYNSEKESYNKKYDIEQFLPIRELDTVLVEHEAIDENFEDILEGLGGVTELTEEQEQANIERERKFREYVENRPYYNEDGLFLYALAKSMKSDATFLHYVEFNRTGLDISPSNLAENYLKNMNDNDLEKWFNKIPLVIDIYYFEILNKFSKK